MKKILLSIFGAALTIGAFAQQTPSPFWTTTLNTNFSNLAAGVVYLDAVDASNVWMIGNDGLAPGKFINQYSKSNNGGTSFTSGTIYADTNTYVVANLDGISGTTAWVSSYLKATQVQGAIHQTTNGGTTWTNMTAPGMYTNTAASFCNIVSFLTPQIGITMGDPVGGEFEIWRTTNGGAAWSAVAGTNIANPIAGEYGLVNVYEENGTTNYWFGTNKNRIYRSTDAGQTWSVSAALTSTIGVAQGISDIAFSNASNGICTALFGPTTTASLTLFKTTDGGQTWTNIAPIDPSFGRSDICGVPGTTVLASAGSASGNNIISYSTDNGVTWNSWGGSNIQYITVDFVSGVTGFAGSFSSQTSAAIGGGWKYTGPSLGGNVGLKENLAPVAMNLYPNPSNGIINLVLPIAKKGLEVTVSDVLGKVIYSETIQNVNSGEVLPINLQGNAKGVYFLSITANGEKSSKKIIIE
jgi:photosystem II stability/assembly factor-like uncharacterized protein